MSDNLNIKDTVEAVKGIVEAVPVYEDLLQPAVIELGKGLCTLSKLINMALAPVSAMVWGYDKICDYITHALEERLKNIPPENIITPDPTIAGPSLEALRYVGHKESLRELYANLIAKSMDKTKCSIAHPSFVEILKQLTPDEAKICGMLHTYQSYPIIRVRAYEQDHIAFAEPVQHFSLLPNQARCDNVNMGPAYLENIRRFGLAEISYDKYCTIHSYDPLENHQFIKSEFAVITATGKIPEIKRGIFERTQLGAYFYNACIK